MIRRDDLQYENLIVYQDTGLDCFSEDAVLLSNFVRAGARDRVVELGAGNGVVSILASAKTGARFTGIERQAAQCRLARRSAEENGQAIDFLEMDVRDAPATLGHGRFTAAVMNPPYFHSGDAGGNCSRAVARHDATGELAAFLDAAFLLLNNGGRLFMIYPAERLADLFVALRAHRLEPKRARVAAVGARRAPTRVLVEAKKDGKPGIRWETLPE